MNDTLKTTKKQVRSRGLVLYNDIRWKTKRVTLGIITRYDCKRNTLSLRFNHVKFANDTKVVY